MLGRLKHGDRDRHQIFRVTSLASNKPLLFLNASFTISHGLSGFHLSSKRNKLPAIPCTVQGQSHLSMFRKDWQQRDLQKPGDRVALPVCLSLVAHNSLGDHFSLRSIIVLLVAVYIKVLHIVARVLWCFDTEPPQKKRLKGDLDKPTENFSLGHFAFVPWQDI